MAEETKQAVAKKKEAPDGPYAVLIREGGSYTLGSLRLEPLTPTLLAGVTLPNGETAAAAIEALDPDESPVKLAASKAEADDLAGKWRAKFDAKRHPKAE